MRETGRNALTAPQGLPLSASPAQQRQNLKGIAGAQRAVHADLLSIDKEQADAAGRYGQQSQHGARRGGLGKRQSHSAAVGVVPAEIAAQHDCDCAAGVSGWPICCRHVTPRPIGLMHCYGS